MDTMTVVFVLLEPVRSNRFVRQFLAVDFMSDAVDCMKQALVEGREDLEVLPEAVAEVEAVED